MNHFRNLAMIRKAVKRLIIIQLILLLLTSTDSFAQKSSKERKIDSLQNVIKKASHDSIVLKAWQK
jgi:hypothetical protein